MPTVLALDVSLSMCRPVQGETGTEEFQRKHLAISGVNNLLDHLSAHCKLEFVSLVSWDMLYEPHHLKTCLSCCGTR